MAVVSLARTEHSFGCVLLCFIEEKKIIEKVAVVRLAHTEHSFGYTIFDTNTIGTRSF